MRTFMPFANEKSCKVTKTVQVDKDSPPVEYALELSPAEVEKATHILGIALSMQAMDPLPSHIKGSPFVIQFMEDDTLRLERRSGVGSIPFSWGEGDDLIVALHDAQAMAVNERKLVHAPRGAHQGTFSEEAF